MKDLTPVQLEWLRRYVPNFAACEDAAKRAIAEAEAIKAQMKPGH